MKQVTTLILVSVVLAVFLGFVLGSPLLTFLSADTDTEAFCKTGWGDEGGGQYPDPDTPTDRNKKGELTDEEIMYLSWTMDGVSEDLGIAGRLRDCGPESFAGEEGTVYVRYAFVTDDNRYIRQDDFPEGVIVVGSWTGAALPTLFPARTIAIDGITWEVGGKEVGIADGSVLAVELQIRAGFSAWMTIARDEVRLIYAIPDVTRGADTFEVGETGWFSWSIPFVELDGAPAYYLTLTDENTGASLGGWDQRPLTAKNGRAEFQVTPDLFSTSPDAANRVRARIYSPIFLADLSDVTVIDDKDLGPRVTSVEFNAPEFREGDRVEITYSASPNPTTGSPIVRYHVLAHIGGDIAYDQDTTSTSVSFIADRTGILEVEVVAYDEASRPSPVYEVEATVGNVIVLCEVNPNLAECRDIIPGIPWALVAAVAVFAIGLLVMLPQLKNPRVFLIALLMLALVAAGVYFVVGGAI